MTPKNIVLGMPLLSNFQCINLIIKVSPGKQCTLINLGCFGAQVNFTLIPYPPYRCRRSQWIRKYANICLFRIFLKSFQVFNIITFAKYLILCYFVFNYLLLIYLLMSNDRILITLYKRVYINWCSIRRLIVQNHHRPT